MPVPCTIRRLTPEDEPWLYAMLYEAIFIPEGHTPPPRDVVQRPPLRKYVDAFGQPGDLGFAAIEAATGQPVGAVWVRVLTAADPGYGFVDEETPELTIAVLPAHRGRGIGTALMEHLLTAAQAHVHAVSLSVWTENPAYRLYRRLGFEVVKEDGPAVTMVKTWGA